MLLLHLGIPPSGHGYAPPIAVAIITVLAKKGLYSAEMHLRVYYSSAPSLSKNFPSMAKNRIGFSICPEKTRRLSGASKLPKEPPAPLPPAERSCQLAQHVSLFLFTNPEFPFQKPVIASLAIGLEPSSLPPVSDISLHKKKREKERLKHSGLDTITSFSCRACHVSDDVSLYKGNPSFRPCPRCGQSNRGCLLLNIRLPE